MQIILQRHGVPNVGKWGRISAKEMPKWIKIYNDSGVDIHTPPSDISKQAAVDHFVICSTLERAKHSAHLLTAKSVKSYAVFCEAEMPVIHIPWFKFTPHIWSIIFRVLWFLGISKDVESRQAIHQRIELSCNLLEDLAKQHKKVMLVSHGIINRLIARELLKRNWQGEDTPNRKKYYGFSSYWEYSIFYC